MPRYFFHVHDGKDFIDDEGAEFASLDEARVGAVVLASDLLKESAGTFRDGEEWSLDVADVRGLILFSLMFTAVAAPAGRREARASASA